MAEAPEVQKLIDLAFCTMKRAYCPYSNFPVGSAILCDDGTYYSGCNVENAVLPLGVCAEKTVITKAVSEGHSKFKAIALSSKMEENFVSPCGACRQFISEFGMDMEVYMTKPDKSYIKMTCRELLPLGFDPDQLDEGRRKNLQTQ